MSVLLMEGSLPDLGPLWHTSSCVCEHQLQLYRNRWINLEGTMGCTFVFSSQVYSCNMLFSWSTGWFYQGKVSSVHVDAPLLPNPKPRFGRIHHPRHILEIALWWLSFWWCDFAEPWPHAASCPLWFLQFVVTLFFLSTLYVVLLRTKQYIADPEYNGWFLFFQRPSPTEHFLQVSRQAQ